MAVELRPGVFGPEWPSGLLTWEEPWGGGRQLVDGPAFFPSIAQAAKETRHFGRELKLVTCNGQLHGRPSADPIVHGEFKHSGAWSPMSKIRVPAARTSRGSSLSSWCRMSCGSYTSGWCRRRHPGLRAVVGVGTVTAKFWLRSSSGRTWQQLPTASFGPSGATAHRRFAEWTKACVWAKLHRLVLDELGSRGELDWSRCAIDSVNMRALKRGT